jgi:hypothetical protein
MDWKLFAQLAVTGIVTVLGWWAVNYFSKRRDIENDRRKMRIEYLLDAYRRLDSASHREGRQSEFEDRLESAVADIQLLGSPKQAALAAQFCMDMATNKIAYMDDLLRDLRDSLRSELKLEPLAQSNRVLRFYDTRGPSPLVGKARAENGVPLDHGAPGTLAGF